MSNKGVRKMNKSVEAYKTSDNEWRCSLCTEKVSRNQGHCFNCKLELKFPIEDVNMGNETTVAYINEVAHINEVNWTTQVHGVDLDKLLREVNELLYDIVFTGIFGEEVEKTLDAVAELLKNLGGKDSE